MNQSLEKILNKLTGQLIFGEDEKIEKIVEYYDKLKKITCKSFPQTEITRFFYELKTEKQSEKLGKEHGADYNNNGINLVITHHATKATVPYLSMTGGESIEEFKKCLEINKIFLHYPLGLQKDYPDIAVNIHVMGNYKNNHFGKDFVGETKEICKKLGISKPYFESRAAGKFPLSYEEIPNDLEIHEKPEVIVDFGHYGTVASYQARENKSTQEKELDNIIQYLDKRKITIGVHVNSHIGDTHEPANLEELKKWKKIIEQPKIEIIMPECWNISGKSTIVADLKERINKYASGIFSIAPKSMRKFLYKTFKANHNNNALFGFEITRNNLIQLYSES